VRTGILISSVQKLDAADESYVINKLCATSEADVANENTLCEVSK
jgi:hypothetical protein